MCASWLKVPVEECGMHCLSIGKSDNPQPSVQVGYPAPVSNAPIRLPDGSMWLLKNGNDHFGADWAPIRSSDDGHFKVSGAPEGWRRQTRLVGLHRGYAGPSL
jgi:hypothetical protein